VWRQDRTVQAENLKNAVAVQCRSVVRASLRLAATFRGPLRGDEITLDDVWREASAGLQVAFVAQSDRLAGYVEQTAIEYATKEHFIGPELEIVQANVRVDAFVDVPRPANAILTAEFAEGWWEQTGSPAGIFWDLAIPPIAGRAAS
jgi:hypothetical protein